MSISAGETLPDTLIHIKTDEGIKETSLKDWGQGRKVVLIAVPGAFTPTCSARHLPGFVEMAVSFHDKGVDAIGCLAVNDAHVMQAWGRDSNAEGRIDMLADPEGMAAEAMGILVVKTPVLGNIRAGRMALIAEDGVVTHIFIEEPGAFEISSAEHVLKHL
ncbi:peroxiredoxin [Alphaproteobacteria bacterium LSUCC0684]